MKNQNGVLLLTFLNDQVFETHITENRIILNGKNALKDLVNRIMELSTRNGKAYYLLPFICTRAFAQLFFNNFTERQMDIFLEDYETFERLFNKHHQKIVNFDIYNSDETKHPVIAFMLYCRAKNISDIKQLVSQNNF